MAVSKTKSLKAKANVPEKAKPTLHEQLRELTDDYIKKSWALYDNGRDRETNIIERIADMRDMLIYGTSLMSIQMGRFIGRNSTEMANTASLLRALASAWDGDDSKFRKVEQEHYDELVEFQEYRYR